MTKEQEKMQAIIEEYKFAIAKAEQAKAIISRFDGKMYNVRVDRALQEIGCYIHKNYGTTDCIYCRGDVVFGDNARQISDKYDISEFASRRTNAAIINAAIDARIADLKKRILQLENELTFGDRLVEYINEQLAGIEKMLDGLSYEFIDAYRSKANRFYGRGLFTR